MLQSFEVLLEYAYRQAIVNVYQGDELLSRDGYTFDRIRLEPDQLLFVRGDRAVLALKLAPSAELERLSGFPRHYAFEQDGIRTELYFP